MPPRAVLETLAYLWPLITSIQRPVAVAGGLALSYWGNPRSTQDIDLAILGTDIKPIESILRNAGFYPVLTSAKNLGLFLLAQWYIESPEHFIDVEVDFLIGDSDYYAVALQRAVSAEIDDVPFPIRILTREDLILHKLYSQRLIDQADVLNLMEMHWLSLDQDYLAQWAQNLKIEQALEIAFNRHLESDRN